MQLARLVFDFADIIAYRRRWASGRSDFDPKGLSLGHHSRKIVVMSFVALKRHCLKTPPGRALEVRAR